MEYVHPLQGKREIYKDNPSTKVMTQILEHMEMELKKIDGNQLPKSETMEK